MSPLSLPPPLIIDYMELDGWKEELLRELDRWVIGLSLVCRRWFYFVNNNLYTYSHCVGEVVIDKTRFQLEYVNRLIDTMKRDAIAATSTSTINVQDSITRYRIDRKKERVFGIIFKHQILPENCKDMSLIQTLHNFIEALTDNPHLRTIRFKGTKTLPFLRMFIKVAGELYMNNKTTKFPSLKLISIENHTQEEDILNELCKVDFLGVKFLQVFSRKFPYVERSMGLDLSSLSSTAACGVKRIINHNPEFVDYFIQNFPQLTKLEFYCTLSPQQLIHILLHLNHLKNLKLTFYAPKKVELYNKWYDNRYIEENPELVSDLINAFNSNTTIKSLSWYIHTDQPTKILIPDKLNLLRMILDTLFVHNHTITELSLTGFYLNTDNILTEKFYESLLSPTSSLTSLILKPASSDNPLLLDLIKNNNCNIKSLLIKNRFNHNFDVYQIVEALEQNQSITKLSIWNPDVEDDFLLRFIERKLRRHILSLIEKISGYPYLRMLCFSCSDTLPFLLEFIKVAGNHTDEEDTILNQLCKVEFLGAKFLEFYNQENFNISGTTFRKFHLGSVPSTAVSRIKGVNNQYPQLVDYFIQNYQQLTNLECGCTITPHQLLYILSNLKHLKILVLRFDDHLNPDTLSKWSDNSYIQLNPELVSDLINAFNSNTTIESLTWSIHTEQSQLPLPALPPPDLTDKFNFIRIIFDQLFINNHTITKFNLPGYYTSELLSDNFYESLLSPSSSLSSLTLSPPKEIQSINPLLYDIIKNNNCKIKTLAIRNQNIPPKFNVSPLLQSLEQNRSITKLDIWYPIDFKESMFEFIKKRFAG
eukprot:gene9297-11394_t